jgi:hypothetical protein
MTIFLPETPSFLLSKGDIDGYKKSIALMTGQKGDVNDLNITDVSEWKLM